MQFRRVIPHNVSYSEIAVVLLHLNPDDIVADLDVVLRLSSPLPNWNAMSRLVRSHDNCYHPPNRRFANICFQSRDFSHFKKASTYQNLNDSLNISRAQKLLYEITRESLPTYEDELSTTKQLTNANSHAD